MRIINPLGVELRPTYEGYMFGTLNLVKSHSWGEHGLKGKLIPVVWANWHGTKLPLRYLCLYP